MALLIGLPLFFEVGFVLLVPIALAIAKKVEMPILRVGLPMLAGLSIAHGLVPPHTSFRPEFSDPLNLACIAHPPRRKICERCRLGQRNSPA